MPSTCGKRFMGKSCFLWTMSIGSFRRGARSLGFSAEMPASVGYQPTLIAEIAELQERIVSTLQGAVTSVQAVYVPADDMTDPAVSAILNHLDTVVVLS